MPTTDVVAPSSMFSVPPLMVIIALIEACIMKNAMAAERAATSFSFLAHTDGNTHRENNRQVCEYNVTGFAHDLEDGIWNGARSHDI